MDSRVQLFIISKIQFLKANHNNKGADDLFHGAVYNIKDTIFES